MDYGRHEGILDDLYHAVDACSATRLAKMRRTPAHCMASLLEDERTPALDFGTAAHAAILEPDTFETLYALDPEHPEKGGYPAGWRNTKAYKDARAELEGQRIISTVDRETCLRLRDAVWNAGGDITAVMEAKAATEVSYLVADPDAGIDLKCRPDIEVPSAHTVVDLKTTVDAGPWAFARSISSYGYHIAKNFYLHTMDLAGLARWDFYLFLVVEKTPPYAVALYDLDPDATDQGRREMDVLLESYARCKQRSEWPAYPSEIRTVGIPAYAYKEPEPNE